MVRQAEIEEVTQTETTYSDSYGVAFFVMGDPATKGSYRPVTNKHTGKVFLKHSAGEKLARWRVFLRHGAHDAWDRRPLLKGAVRLEVGLLLRRPKSHHANNRRDRPLKKTAPRYPKIKRNDVDKLIRAVMDELSGTVYVDDGQVCSLKSTKTYARQEEDIGASIFVESMEPELENE